MKKLIPILLAFVLILSLIPNYSFTQQADAAVGNRFLFPNEKYSKDQARMVSNKYITLTGTLNGVIGSSISYKVEQITLGDDRVRNSTEEITTGIMLSGDNQITISNIELFPGLNKITFIGVSDGKRVEDPPIFIEYRDSPMLHDLKVTFETTTHDLVENGLTMLYSNSDIPQETGIIDIEGYAPNASKVTVVINGAPYDFVVSQSSNAFRFVAPRLTIKKGMNTITFKVSNGNQVIETTRQIALYTGDVTYFEEKLINDGKTYDITYDSSYSVNNTRPIIIQGKAIIPLPLYDGTTAIDNTDTAAVTTALQNTMRIVLNGTPATNHSPDSITFDSGSLTADTKYLTVNYSYTFAANVLPLDSVTSFTYRAPNLNQGLNTSTTRRFTLRDGTKAFIADINYLSGFENSMTEPYAADEANKKVARNPLQLLSLSSTDIDLAKGADIYTLPLALEVVVTNYSSLGNLANLTKAQLDLTINGKAGKYFFITDANGTPLNDVVTSTIDGAEVSQMRLFLQLNELDKSGTNALRLKFNLPSNAVADAFPVTLKLQYGPYVRFDGLADGMAINYDSIVADELYLIEQTKFLTGQIMNVANLEDIVYETISASERQTVFLYLNNVPIEIEGVSTDPVKKKKGTPSFKIKNLDASNIRNITDPNDPNLILAKQIISYMNKSGENTIKFVFRTATYSYENTIRFNIVPVNLPIVPAEGTDGVYPYSVNTWPPSPSDSKFNYTNGVYSTKESEFNVYGTFDFIDLGAGHENIDSKLISMDESVKQGFKVQISSPEWSESREWDLSRELRVTDANRTIQRVPDTGVERVYGVGKVTDPKGIVDDRIRFYYNEASQTFFFNIIGEKLPDDGSPMVYTITVYNAGESGPRATYRLEINSIAIPYKIELPVEENRIVNQNYVEVIISAPGAESMTINKLPAEAIDYNVYSGNTVTTKKAFRAFVTLKSANKDVEIPFTITRGETTTSDSFKVRYVPTNIPGAQYMEAMKSSHKVFNGAVTLNFPKNTNLIRSSYLTNAENGFPTQVYNGNEILFAIAHPEDGIVDRHNFEEQAGGYSSVSTNVGKLHIKTRFEADAGRFIKASPLYWIDAGLADDSETSDKYDPITRGLDPFPYPRSSDVMNHPNFSERVTFKDRQLVPSSPGTLTLSYDSSIVQSAGTTISVFRFDPYNSIWENIGGVVDEKKGTVTVPFTKFGYYVAVKLTRSYNDIIDHKYARESMEAIYSKGIMNAVEPVGRFGGDEYITRGEFTRMIVKALDLPLNYEGSLHFTYYPETVTNASNTNAIYDYRYIETAARAGIVNGTRPGFFGEDVSITRQDAAVILARALELKLETNATKARNDLDKAFKDGASFDFYAIPAVLAIQKQGFIVGKMLNASDPKEGYVYDPKARMLRSDAAIIMARVMNKLKKLPKIYG